jgi:hypothetical protein
LIHEHWKKYSCQAFLIIPREVSDRIAKNLNLPDEVLDETLKSGGSKFHNQVAWARQYLVWENSNFEAAGKIGYLSASFPEDEEDYSKWQEGWTPLIQPKAT